MLFYAYCQLEHGLNRGSLNFHIIVQISLVIVTDCQGLMLNFKQQAVLNGILLRESVKELELGIDSLRKDS